MTFVKLKRSIINNYHNFEDISRIVKESAARQPQVDRNDISPCLCSKQLKKNTYVVMYEIINQWNSTWILINISITDFSPLWPEIAQTEQATIAPPEIVYVSWEAKPHKSWLILSPAWGVRVPKGVTRCLTRKLIVLNVFFLYMNGQLLGLGNRVAALGASSEQQRVLLNNFKGFSKIYRYLSLRKNKCLGHIHAIKTAVWLQSLSCED